MAYILVVDDDIAVRQLLTDVLEIEGHEVRTAVDGPSAVQAFEMLRPDFVILDAMMPGLDGFGVLRIIRAFDDEPVPVVMLTAAAEPGAAARAWNDGVDYFLAKPFTPDRLLELVDGLIGPHHLSAPNGSAD